MKNIQELVKVYLSQKTEYAIQIVGNWGTGKTYFYRNILARTISETTTIENHKRTYKPIYISLFGLKSTEDIATKIVLEFYQSKWFKDYFTEKKNRKTLRITEGIFKIGLRGFLNFQRLGNINDYITDIKEIGKDVLNENELLICFDDLERKDSSLNLEDLIGYINSLIDEGIKVLIISNEDTLKKVSENNYTDLKEKVIGITVPFMIPIEQTINNIIINRYQLSGHKVYADFLVGNINCLIKITEANNRNLRHLIYALDTFQKFYSQININILSGNNEIKEHVIEKLEHLTTIFLALAVEYKSSSIKSDEAHKLIEPSISYKDLLGSTTNRNKDEIQKEESLDSDILIKKYSIPRREYKFFDSIFQYVTNAQEFNITAFIEEFKSLYKLNKGRILPEYVVMEKLSHGDCLELSEIEYVEYTKKLIDNAKKGKYLPSEYYTVMYYAERYGNPLDIELDQLNKELKSGLKKSLRNVEEKSREFYRFESSASPKLSVYNQDLYESGKKEISKILDERKALRSSQHLSFLKTNPKKFFQDYEDMSEFRYSVDQLDIYNKISPNELTTALIDSDNFTLEIFYYFLNNRYEKNSCSKDEFQTVTKLKKEFKAKLVSIPERIKSHLVSEIIKRLELVEVIK